MTEQVEVPQKQWFIIKTNGVANIRTLNALLPVAPEQKINFWMAGYFLPRKYRRTATLKKSFLFYDYMFIELSDAPTFERFLSDRGVSAYFLHRPGTKDPIPLTEEEVRRIKSLEAFKQLEADQFKATKLRPGSYIEVVNGPFIGCKGAVVDITSTHATLELNVFGRPTRVSVGLDFLENLLSDCDNPVTITDDDLEADV